MWRERKKTIADNICVLNTVFLEKFNFSFRFLKSGCINFAYIPFFSSLSCYFLFTINNFFRSGPEQQQKKRQLFHFWVSHYSQIVFAGGSALVRRADSASHCWLELKRGWWMPFSCLFFAWLWALALPLCVLCYRGPLFLRSNVRFLH